MKKFFFVHQFNEVFILNRLEEIKQDIATKLEKTAKLNLDNTETTKELESMKEAHQIMIDSLKLQMETFNKELQHIRNTRYEKKTKREKFIS
jgi:CHASE3 domain sensor protein